MLAEKDAALKAAALHLSPKRERGHKRDVCGTAMARPSIGRLHENGRLARRLSHVVTIGWAAFRWVRHMLQVSRIVLRGADAPSPARYQDM